MGDTGKVGDDKGGIKKTFEAGVDVYNKGKLRETTNGELYDGNRNSELSRCSGE